MKEKDIIKGKLKNSKKFKFKFWIGCLIISFFLFVVTYSDNKQHFMKERDHYCEWCYDTYYGYDKWSCELCERTYFEDWSKGLVGPIITFIPIGIYLVVFIYIIVVWDVMELTVTNKRIYGKTIFGKRVDLPLDSISSISRIKIFNGISVATSSGKISFQFMDNNENIYNSISQLLVERQDEKSNGNSDYIEELKKIKELMDDGIITRDEFEKKKKELLK